MIGTSTAVDTTLHGGTNMYQVHEHYLYLPIFLIRSRNPVIHGVMVVAKRRFTLLWRCHRLLSVFLANGHLPRVSRQSRIRGNNKVEMIPGTVHRY